MDSPNTITSTKQQFNYYTEQKKYWLNDSPIMTIYANAITSSVPFGERFVILSVLTYLKDIKNKALRKKVIHFVRQEASHSKEHLRFYRRIVKPHYPNLQVKKQRFYKISQVGAYLLGKRLRLCMVAAVEHLTAITASLYLSDEMLFNGVHKELSSIWYWHFKEEIEHKDVAFDVMQEIGCGYFMRLSGFILATLFLFVGFISPFIHMVIQDRLYKKSQFYTDSFRLFWINPGILRRLFIPYLRYLKPFFHPNK